MRCSTRILIMSPGTLIVWCHVDLATIPFFSGFSVPEQVERSAVKPVIHVCLCFEYFRDFSSPFNCFVYCCIVKRFRIGGI
jgi:hypothetical protein